MCKDAEKKASSEKKRKYQKPFGQLSNRPLFSFLPLPISTKFKYLLGCFYRSHDVRVSRVSCRANVHLEVPRATIDKYQIKSVCVYVCVCVFVSKRFQIMSDKFEVVVVSVEQTCSTWSAAAASSESTVNEVYLVFDGEQASRLRHADYRLCGKLIGMQQATTTTATATAAQCDTSNTSALDKRSTCSSLPMQLSFEQLAVLIKIASSSSSCELALVRSNHNNTEQMHMAKSAAAATEAVELKRIYDERVSLVADEESAHVRRQRLEQMSSMRAKIVAGKRRKLTAQLAATKPEDEQRTALLREQLANVEANFDKELEGASHTSSATTAAAAASTETRVMEIYTQTPASYRRTCFPLDTLSASEFMASRSRLANTCKCRAFAYLWSRGYYLTCGAKFGGDYLVYAGDPARVHSQFVLVCVESAAHFAQLSLRQMVTFARMATSVKKTFVVAHCSPLSALSGLGREREDSSSCLPPAGAASRLSVVLDDGLTELTLVSINWSHM